MARRLRLRCYYSRVEPAIGEFVALGPLPWKNEANLLRPLTTDSRLSTIVATLRVECLLL